MKEADVWFHSFDQKSKTRKLISICINEPACEAQIHIIERQTKEAVHEFNVKCSVRNVLNLKIKFYLRSGYVELQEIF
jgi:hypothetical protein